MEEGSKLVNHIHSLGFIGCFPFITWCNLDMQSKELLVDCLDMCVFGYVVRYGLKKGNQRDMCLKEIGLYAQGMVTILGSIFNLIGGEVYMTI